MTTPNITAPRTAEELYGLATEAASDLKIPGKWRDDAIQEFVIAAFNAGQRSETNPRAHQVIRGRGAMVDFIRHEITMNERGPGECPTGAMRISFNLPVMGQCGEPTTLDETIPDQEGHAPDENLLWDERKAAVRSAMACLAPDERAAAVAVLIEDQTQEEAAITLNKTRKEIRHLLAMAMDRLPSMLRKYKHEYSRP